LKSEVLHSVGTFEVVVTDEMTARLEGLVHHPVYSTFWLAYHAECAARKAIVPYFDEDDDAVGSSIEIKHLAMAPVGAKVVIEARVAAMNGKRIECEITAKWGETIIARGTQSQYVMSKQALGVKLQALGNKL